METRKQKSVEKVRDPDLTGAEAAMNRAAENVRRWAEETSGVVVVLKNGKIVKEKPGKKWPE